jgi:hypothetical protein
MQRAPLNKCIMIHHTTSLGINMFPSPVARITCTNSSCTSSWQATHLGKPVFPSLLADAQPVSGRHAHGTLMLLPIKIVSVCGKSEILCSEDSQSRDEWLRVMNDAILVQKGQGRAQRLEEYYQVRVCVCQLLLTATFTCCCLLRLWIFLSSSVHSNSWISMSCQTMSFS